MACHEYRTTDDHAVLTCFLGQLYPVSDCSQSVPEDCFALRRKNHEACRCKLCHATCPLGKQFLAWFIKQFNPAGANALFQIVILVPGTKLQLAAET